jgi:hypothetical protein
MNNNDPYLFNVSDNEFQSLINFAIQDGAITSCNRFEKDGAIFCLITTIQLHSSVLEPVQTLKDEIFPLELAKVYLTGLLRGCINGRVSQSQNLFFDLSSGWHR